MTLHLQTVVPSQGPTRGGNLVEVVGTGLTHPLHITFDNVPVPFVHVASSTSAFVQAPPGEAGPITVQARACCDRACLPAAYTYRRPELDEESDLTRLVRTLLRMLKRHVLQTTSMTISIDCARPDDESGIIGAPLASLPALVLTGPDLCENRRLSVAQGPEVRDACGHTWVYPPPLTVDLSFRIIGAASKTVEMLNLLAAVTSFVQGNPWLALAADGRGADRGIYRWEMVPAGEARTHLDSPEGVRSFSCGLVVRGFDIGDARPTRMHVPVDAVSVGLDAWRTR